jgi:hypothetical protein
VRGHDDEVAVAALGHVDHAFGHEVGLDDLGGHADLACLSLGLDGVEHGLCIGGPLAFDAFDLLEVHGLPALEIAARIVLDDLDDDHAGAAQGGQVQSAVHGLVGKLGTVGGDQDAVVHACSFRVC